MGSSYTYNYLILVSERAQCKSVTPMFYEPIKAVLPAHCVWNSRDFMLKKYECFKIIILHILEDCG